MNHVNYLKGTILPTFPRTVTRNSRTAVREVECLHLYNVEIKNNYTMFYVIFYISGPDSITDLK
jgi:hypothetical protein